MTTGGGARSDFVVVEHLTKTFRAARGSQAVTFGARDVSFRVAAGEMVALLGPSGSGKSTLLRCIAGLEQPEQGEIAIDGRVVFSAEQRIDTPPAERNIGLIFQTYALWPNMTVRQNIEYPLARRGKSSAQRSSAVSRYLDMVGCAELVERYPHELSGGQQQRVALARSLVYEPSLILFDEPLSNLDAALREQLRFQIRLLQRRLGFTGIYVTHDQREAFLLADRVAVVSAGEIVQIDTPDTLNARPASYLVADFLGATNVVHGVLHSIAGAWLFSTADGQSLDVSSAPGLPEPGAPTEAQAVLVARPEDAQVVPDQGAHGLRGRVADVVTLGKHVEYVVTLDGAGEWRCHATRTSEPVMPAGSPVRVLIAPEDAHVFWTADLRVPAASGV
jgi:iron(III) transport system ATP-binding protein